MQQDSEKELKELLRSVDRLQELVEEKLDQANAEKVGQAEEVADSLEAEIRALRKRDNEMKDLARCEDHIHYLQVGTETRVWWWWWWGVGEGVISSSNSLCFLATPTADVRVHERPPRNG